MVSEEPQLERYTALLAVAEGSRIGAVRHRDDGIRFNRVLLGESTAESTTSAIHGDPPEM